jgi:hypothetical protein
MLEESAGARMSVAAVCGAGIDLPLNLGSQQKVSLFHKRHAKFSSLFPSFMACDVLEKIDHCARC